MAQRRNVNSTENYMKAKLLIVAVLVAFLATPVSANWAPGDAQFINTWLVLGTFDNREGAGMKADLIGEATIRPRTGEQVAGKTWGFFDDRTFSRNYDDYQDLFSYFFVKQDDPRDGRMAYLHTWVWSPRAQQVELRVGVNHEWSARINGEVVTLPTPSDVPPGPAPGPHSSHDKALYRPGVQYRLKDAMMRKVSLRTGWNSLLLKVGNRPEGLLGFYARLSDGAGNAIPDLVYSVNGPTEKLAVTTQALPTAWRSWSYVEFKIPGVEALEKRVPELSRFSYAWAQASAFRLNAEGTKAAFRWDLSEGKLPSGLSLTSDGRIVGRVDPSVHLGEFPLVVRVTDAASASAEKRLVLHVKENPTRAVEQSRMTALIHGPGDGVTIDLTQVKEDVADTIIRLELKQPLPESAVPRLAPFKRTARGGGKQVPGNLAWQKPGRLLSLDGTQVLGPSSEVYFASLAVDGDPNSFAVAGGHFAWTLEIDLGEARTVSRVRILFAKSYPTDYAIAVSADGDEWTEVHRGAGTPNGKYEHAFAATSVRYVRAISYKPNGRGQEGGQMCVAELEVYEK